MMIVGMMAGAFKHPFKRPMSLAAAAAAMLMGGATHAATWTCSGTSSRLWSDPQCWLNNVVPVAGAGVLVPGNNSAETNIQINADVGPLGVLHIASGGGNMALTITQSSGALSVTGPMFVGVNGPATYLQRGGTVSTDTVGVGLHAGTVGSYVLNGQLNTHAVLVGSNGQGYMRNENGVLSATGYMVVGADAASTSRYDAIGNQTTSVAGDLSIGSQNMKPVGGGGKFVQSGGATVIQGVTRLGTVMDAALLGTGAPPTGLLDIQGGSFTTSILHVGHSGVGATGTFHMSNGSFSGGITLGYGVGTTGTALIEGGTVTTSGMSVGTQGTGSVEQRAGNLQGNVVLAHESTGRGTYTMKGGSISGNYLDVGVQGVGNFVQSGGSISASLGGWINEASSFALSGTGSLSMSLQNKGRFTQSGGTFSGSLANLGSADFSGGVFSGTLNNSGTATFHGGTFGGKLVNMATGSVVGQGAITNLVANSGSITAAANGTLTLTGPMVANDGSLTAKAGATLLFGQGLETNRGMIVLEGGAFQNNGMPLTNGQSGQIHIMSGGQLNSERLSNAGHILMGDGMAHIGGTLVNAPGGSVEVAGQAVFDGDVLNDGSFQVRSGGTALFSARYEAGGRLFGDGQARFSGGFYGAHGPSIMTVELEASFLQGAWIDLKVGDTASGSCTTCSDKLVFTHGVTLNGTQLRLDAWGEHTPHAGDVFDLFDWSGPLVGSFSDIVMPTLAIGLAWDTSKLYTTGEISVRAVPEPSTWTLMGAGLVAVGATRRRSAQRLPA